MHCLSHILLSAPIYEAHSEYPSRQAFINIFDKNKTALIRFYFNNKESFKEKVNFEILKLSNAKQPLSHALKDFFNSGTLFSSIEELEKWLHNQQNLSLKVLTLFHFE